ncbi:hypothetical protein H7X87_01975 [Acetobacteraceae bacterium]|nr:hypothetical protein [Candidatus Parcubacteria bacterium]
MNTKVVLGILVVLLVGGGIYFYSQKDSDATEIEGQITAAEDGWSQYDNDTVGFKYPSNWELTTSGRTMGTGPFGSVHLQGDGYIVEFTTIGKGFPSEDNTQVGEHVVAGQKTKTLENKTEAGFHLGVGSFCGSWSVRISSPTNSKNIADRILDSIQCPE